MTGNWSYRPERAPDCMNGRFLCSTYACERLLKHPGHCLACKRTLKSIKKAAKKKDK